MSLSILDIWNVTEEKSYEYIDILIERNYKSIAHKDPYVVSLSLFSQTDFFNEQETKILRSTCFFDTLKNSELDHNKKLIYSLYNCEPTISLSNIESIESNIMSEPRKQINEDGLTKDELKEKLLREELKEKKLNEELEKEKLKEEILREELEEKKLNEELEKEKLKEEILREKLKEKELNEELKKEKLKEEILREELKKKEPIKDDLYEMTHNVDMAPVCKFKNKKYKDGEFLDDDGDLLDAKNIFQVGGYCYNVDDLFRFIGKGGTIHEIPKLYLNNFFKKIIDYSNRNISDSDAKNITFHHEAELIDLGGNNFINLDGVYFPENVNHINLENNQLNELKCTFPKNLKIIDLSNTKLTDVGDNINKNIQTITCNNCKSLKEIHLKSLRELKSFTASYTNMEDIFQPNISENIVTLEVTHSSELKNIDVHGLNNVKTLIFNNCDSLINVDANRCKNLKKLILSGNNNLENVIAESCDNFTLNDCNYDEITDNIIPHGVKNLFLKNNKNLTNLSLVKCNKLKSINISGCDNFKHFTREKFNSQLKSIAVTQDKEVTNNSKSFFKNKKEELMW